MISECDRGAACRNSAHSLCDSPVACVRILLFKDEHRTHATTNIAIAAISNGSTPDALARLCFIKEFKKQLVVVCSFLTRFDAR